MASMISEGLDHLYETHHSADVAGELISYHRGDYSASFLATLEKPKVTPPSMLSLEPGRYDTVQSNPKNIDHDFGVMAVDLVLNGSLATPQRGDLIKRTFNGSTQVYELMAPTGGGLIWEWMDGYDKRYLIHAKYVRSE